jgi:hypothetical protein
VVEVPEHLKDYAVESAKATDYDLLLLGNAAGLTKGGEA